MSPTRLLTHSHRYSICFPVLGVIRFFTLNPVANLFKITPSKFSDNVHFLIKVTSGTRPNFLFDNRLFVELM